MKGNYTRQRFLRLFPFAVVLLAVIWSMTGLYGQGNELLTTREEILITPQPGSHYGPSIAFDSANQRFLVIYNENNESLKGQLLKANGDYAGSSFIISPGAHCCFTSVAYDSVNQRFLAVWAEWRGESSNWDIRAQLLNPNGRLIGSSFTISATLDEQQMPLVAFDPVSQHFLIVWDGFQSQLDDWNVYGQLVKADGRLFGTEIPIAVGKGKHNRPNVVYDSVNQRFFIVYTEEDAARLGQFVATDGKLFGNAFQALKSACWSNRTGLAFDATHRQFLVVGVSCLNENISGQMITAEGTLLGGPFSLSMPGSINIDDGVQIAAVYDPAGERFMAVWETTQIAFLEKTSEDVNIFGRQVNADGTLFPDREVPLAASSIAEVRPAIAYGAVNRDFLLVWEDQRGDIDVYGRLFTELPPL